jgi:uncharacterized protein (DUF1800 family)
MIFQLNIYLEKGITSGLNGREDLKRAIDIIINNCNVTSFISKNLIIRLAKSNPSTDYIKRVAYCLH